MTFYYPITLFPLIINLCKKITMARQFITGSDYRTKVTINPSFQFTTLDDGFIPEAIVEICYLNANNRPLIKASFYKVLDNTPFLGDPDAIIHYADDLISGDLKVIGLDGLCTLDIYNEFEGKPFSPVDFRRLLESKLSLRYYDRNAMNDILDIHGPNDYPIDGFYDLVFNGLEL